MCVLSFCTHFIFLFLCVPPSIMPVVIYVESNKTACQQTELSQKEFNSPFTFQVPLPVWPHGFRRFSRILTPNTFSPIVESKFCVLLTNYIFFGTTKSLLFTLCFPLINLLSGLTKAFPFYNNFKILVLFSSTSHQEHITLCISIVY